MADDLLGRLSGTGNPYVVNTYTPATNEENTLTITNYFKLLAVQLVNQDMINLMDNSEMMAQVAQVVTIQVVSAMTESVQAPTSVSTQVYAAGFVEQEITVAVTEEGKYGRDMAVGVRHGEVESVDFTGSTPALKLVGDDNEYSLSYALGMGKIDDPYKKDEADGKQIREKDVESERTGFPACDCAAGEGSPLMDKGIFV